jgi:hypothetical protein
MSDREHVEQLKALAYELVQGATPMFGDLGTSVVATSVLESVAFELRELADELAEEIVFRDDVMEQGYGHATY